MLFSPHRLLMPLILAMLPFAGCKKSYSCNCVVTSTVEDPRSKFSSTRTYTQNTQYDNTWKWSAQSQCNSKKVVEDNSGVISTNEYACTLVKLSN